MILIIRGHIRKSFTNTDLLNFIKEIYNIEPDLKIYIHTWSIFSNNISWRTLEIDDTCVTKEIFYDYALIDSYKTSVFMNDLFRKIKENKNLDLLEESDDEEEFENIDLEKYVNLGKSYIIECFYNKKFKKWIPKNLAKNNYIIDKNKINLIKNKNKIFL